MKTFPQYKKTLTPLLRLPYAAIGMIVAIITVLAMYGWCYHAQTYIAQHVSSLEADQLANMITQINRVLFTGVIAAAGSIIISGGLNLYTERQTLAGFMDTLARRTSQDLMSMVQNPTLDAQTRQAAIAIMKRREPGLAL
jgi:hypothetical protein